MKERKLILLAEDDADDRDLFRESFKAIQFDEQVVYFETGLELVSHLNSLPSTLLPSLIVLDYNMPILSGLETLRHLKKHNKFNHISVVIYTTGISKELQELVLAEGAAACVRKHYTFDDLLETVKEFKQFATGRISTGC